LTVKPDSAAIETDIAIIGGGMMGSTLALMIRRALPELSVMLIESKPFSPVQGQLPSFDERSTAISPTTVDVFKDLSLWQALSDCASPIENIDITDQGQPGRATLTPADNYGRPLGYVVRNGGMGHSLTSAVLESAVSVKAPSTVVNLTPNKSGVQIHLQDQQVVNTRLLIAADGAASPVRGFVLPRKGRWPYCLWGASKAHMRPSFGLGQLTSSKRCKTSHKRNGKRSYKTLLVIALDG